MTIKPTPTTYETIVADLAARVQALEAANPSTSSLEMTDLFGTDVVGVEQINLLTGFTLTEIGIGPDVNVDITPYTSFSPTLTADTVNPANWDTDGWYAQIGEFVHYFGSVSAPPGGGSTMGSGEWIVDLPVTADALTAGENGFLGGTAKIVGTVGGLGVSITAIQFQLVNFPSASGIKFGYLAAYPRGAPTNFGSATTWTPGSSGGDVLAWDAVYRHIL